MDFGEAIRNLKSGHKVARSGWNGKGMYIYLKPAGTKEYEGTTYTRDAYIVMKTAGDTLQAGWLASQADMLAEDYYIVN